MNYLTEYPTDGANWQARCVLAYLSSRYMDDRCDIFVTRYNNCREQGYIFVARYKEQQRNYAVYEHRNTDTLCVVVNDTLTETLPDSSVIYNNMADKWDVTEEFHMGEIVECGDFIATDIFTWADAVEENQK